MFKCKRDFEMWLIVIKPFSFNGKRQSSLDNGPQPMRIQENK